MSPFAITVAINYEDTDAGGVVYYANYLGYMERARNAYLRAGGYPLHTLAAQQLLFVVTAVNIRYLAPAHLDDALHITMAVVQLGAARLTIAHEVLREANCLVTAEVTLATVHSGSHRPRRMPSPLRDYLNNTTHT